MMAQTSTGTIWNHFKDDLRRFIRRRVADDHVADDLLQETFVRVHRGIEGLQDADRLAPWVYRIARNLIHDHHRRAPKTEVALDAEIAHEGEESHNEQRCNGICWLNELIQSVPEGYRDAVRLAEIEGLAQQQVADQLGLSLSGAKSRIQRGRAMLKTALHQCCTFEFDVRGNMIDYEPRPDRKVCKDCGE